MQNPRSGLSKAQVWSLVVAIGVILGIIGSCITIYEFPSFFRNISGSGSTPTPDSTQIRTGNTPTQASSTQVSSSNPSPTPTSPPPGTPLYRANSAWSGWNGTKDWKVNGGLLLDDGTYADYNANPTIDAPYQSQTADYRVDLQMQVLSAFTTGTIYPCFYIAIRGTASSNGWQGYAVAVCANLGRGPAVQIVAVDSSNNIFDILSTAPFDPQNAWHSYRVEAKGTTIKFFVDDGLLLSADDSRYLNAGQIGLWSEYMQVKLSSFNITAL